MIHSCETCATAAMKAETSDVGYTGPLPPAEPEFVLSTGMVLIHTHQGAEASRFVQNQALSHRALEDVQREMEQCELPEADAELFWSASLQSVGPCVHRHSFDFIFNNLSDSTCKKKTTGFRKCLRERTASSTAYIKSGNSVRV